MEKLDLKVFVDGKEKLNYTSVFEDITYLEEYIELKKYACRKFELIETNKGFYFYNDEGKKIEYKFTY